MKISIKLKPDEVRALVEVFERCIDTESCMDRMDAIITVIMVRMYKKLKEKSILMEKPIRLNIPPDMAMAFCEFFFAIPFDNTSFGGNLLQRLLAHFDQQTSNYY